MGLISFRDRVANRCFHFSVSPIVPAPLSPGRPSAKLAAEGANNGLLDPVLADGKILPAHALRAGAWVAPFTASTLD